jgi:TatD DNase family protein
MAQELLRRGWYLGFDGPITYKNARKSLEVLEICPLDRILIETDSPYLSPVPRRGKRNDSRNLVYIIEKIAEIKGITPTEAAASAMANGKRLFHIKENAS